MSRYQRLQDILSTHLSPTELAIDDETRQHSVPAGSESHFKILIVSESFHSLTRIARHRLVNQLVSQEFNNGLHALSLHLYTPTEWEQKNAPVRSSPSCKGGSHYEATHKKGTL
jgi:BolA protein